MTTEIIVEKVDREAAVALTRFLGEPESFISDMLDGLLDGTDTVQAFARHRLAERKRCAEVLREAAITYTTQESDIERAVCFELAADEIERGKHITTGQEEGA